MTHAPPLGIVEGFYGKRWSFEDRRHVVTTLAPHGFGFYHYAPKADAHLRDAWRTPHTDADAADLKAFATFCRARGIRFGVGLSPMGAAEAFTTAMRADLETKIAGLCALGVDDLLLLFDDMRVADADIAAKQAEVVACARAAAPDQRLIVCPSYYTDDHVLDRVFGARPPGYLQDFARRTPADVDIFWTGEEVCARAISAGHLARVADQLGRLPVLWDNYPVNDGPRMSRYLHIRGVTGRPASIGPYLRAHAVNPALQPHLSCLPALTLAASYRDGEDYAYMAAFRAGATALFGAAIAAHLEADLYAVQDDGLDRLSAERTARMRARWAAIDHPAAAEIVGWLDGGYAYGADALQTV